MKKSIFLFFALFGVMMSAQAVDYYYRGERVNNWGAGQKLEVSIDGYYSYIYFEAGSEHQFKICEADNDWDKAAYGKECNDVGFNGTDVTELGDHWGGDNCKIWSSNAHYVLVYHPNTKINTTNKVKICASTFLPDNRECYLMGVDGDWTTGIKMMLNSKNSNEFILLDQPIKNPIKFKVKGNTETWTDEVENYDKNGVDWKDGNIVLPAGNYDFYFKKDIMKVYIARNTVVTTTANPSEGGTLTGAGVYNNDEEVTLKATPNTGYNFVNWTKGGTQVSANATYTFQAAGDVEYVANFELKTYTVKFLNYDGEVLQSSTVNHGETPVYSGKTPEHPADAQYTYTFSGWDNAIAAATSDQTYKAQFNTIVNQYTITVNAENGTVTGAGTYDYGTSVTITATPDTGYEFVNWTKAGVEVSTDASYTFTVTEDAEFVANFEKETYTRTVTAGKFGTLCLPFGGTVEGAELFECVGQETGKVYIASVTKLQAGVPYIFLATGTELAVYSDGTTAATPGDHNGLHGTFDDETQVALGNYILKDNELRPSDGTAKVNANRAYLVMSEVPGGAPQQMPGRRYIGISVQGENAATGLDNITNGENTTIKVIENGQLIIIRNGEKFNAQGQKL